MAGWSKEGGGQGDSFRLGPVPQACCIGPGPAASWCKLGLLFPLFPRDRAGLLPPRSALSLKQLLHKLSAVRSAESKAQEVSTPTPSEEMEP